MQNILSCKKKKKRKSGSCFHESYICTGQWYPLIKNPWGCSLIKGNLPLKEKKKKSPQNFFLNNSHVKTPPPLRRSRPLGHAHGRRALLLMLWVSRHPRTLRDVVSLNVSPCSSECWMNHHRTYSMPTYSSVGSPQLPMSKTLYISRYFVFCKKRFERNEGRLDDVDDSKDKRLESHCVKLSHIFKHRS